MNIGKLGFGMMRLPILDQNDPTSFDLELLGRMVDTFLERGFNYFDTSFVYHNGQSETATRKALVERHDRSEFFLATKLPAFNITGEAQVRETFEEQLANCGVSSPSRYGFGSEFPFRSVCVLLFRCLFSLCTVRKM